MACVKCTWEHESGFSETEPFGLVFEGCTWSSGVKIHVGEEGWFSTWFWGCLQGRLVEPWSGGPFLLTSGTTALEAYSRLGLGFDPPNCFFSPCSLRVFGFVWIWEEEGRGACTCVYVVTVLEWWPHLCLPDTAAVS